MGDQWEQPENNVNISYSYPIESDGEMRIQPPSLQDNTTFNTQMTCNNNGSAMTQVPQFSLEIPERGTVRRHSANDEPSAREGIAKFRSSIIGFRHLPDYPTHSTQSFSNPSPVSSLASPGDYFGPFSPVVFDDSPSNTKQHAWQYPSNPISPTDQEQNYMPSLLLSAEGDVDHNNNICFRIEASPRLSDTTSDVFTDIAADSPVSIRSFRDYNIPPSPMSPHGEYRGFEYHNGTYQQEGRESTSYLSPLDFEYSPTSRPGDIRWLGGLSPIMSGLHGLEINAPTAPTPSVYLQVPGNSSFPSAEALSPVFLTGSPSPSSHTFDNHSQLQIHRLSTADENTVKMEEEVDHSGNIEVGSPVRKVGSAAIDEASTRRRRKHPRFPCTIPGCGKSFTANHNLKHHLNAHRNIRNYECRVCSDTFTTPHVLARHEKKCPKMKKRSKPKIVD